MQITANQNACKRISKETTHDFTAPPKPIQKRNASFADEDLTGNGRVREQRTTECSENKKGQCGEDEIEHFAAK